MTDTKAKPQSHLDYLLTTIEGEMDIEVTKYAPTIRAIADAFKTGLINGEDAHDALIVIRRISQNKAQNWYRTNMLLAAVTDYIIDPQRKIHDFVAADTSQSTPPISRLST